MNTIKRVAYQAFTSLVRQAQRLEYLNQKSTELNERSVEYSFALKCVYRTSAQTILDVGSGTSPLPALLRTCGCIVTAIDSMGEFLERYIFNRHYYIIKDNIIKCKLSGTYDLITCISTLEHIPNHQEAIRSMFGLLKPGGYLVLTFPYNESTYVKNVYQLPGAGYGQNARHICQAFSRQEVNLWLAENQGKIIEQQYFQLFNGAFWTFGGRIFPPREVSVTDSHHLTLILIQGKTGN